MSNSFTIGQRIQVIKVVCYLVETWTVVLDMHKFKELVISVSISLWTEWLGKREFQKLSLMLKSPDIMRTLLILASISLKYFKAIWEESE